MARSQGDGDLIAAIYDAIIEPSGWDEVVKRIVEATKSASSTLWVQQSDAAHLSATCNIDPLYADAFVQHYYKINPLNAAAATIAPGEVRTATHITQTDSFRASAYCNEFVRPQGCADVVAIGLLRTPKAAGHLTLQRSPEAIWVEPAEWQLLETLAPHLRRAAAIHDLLARTRPTTESLGAAVAAASFAVFLLTGDCRVVFANAKAEDLARHGIGLRYERGRLAATSPALTARLHALARHGSQPERGEGDIGGTLELCRGENRPPLVAHVIPLAPIRTVAIFDLDRPAAAVFIVGSRRRPRRPNPALCRKVRADPRRDTRSRGNHRRKRASRRRHAAQNHRGDGAHPREARSRENRNQPSNGTHPPVSRDRLARLARRGLALQKYKFRLSPHVIGTDDVRAEDSYARPHAQNSPNIVILYERRYLRLMDGRARKQNST
jgi:hypothetical protein